MCVPCFIHLTQSQTIKFSKFIHKENFFIFYNPNLWKILEIVYFIAKVRCTKNTHDTREKINSLITANKQRFNKFFNEVDRSIVNKQIRLS
jgi:hypothetical protein